jgi:hypothetical protein
MVKTIGSLMMLTAPLTGIVISLTSGGGFTGFGLVIFIVGLIIFFVADSSDNPGYKFGHNVKFLNETERNEKNITNESKNTTYEVSGVFKFKNGFDISNSLEVNNESFWIYNGKFFSVANEFVTSSARIGFLVQNGEYNINKREILIQDINYYVVEGEFTRETKISGGGTSIGGAIVGAVVAGGVGAVIGSRKSIKSEIINHDNRKVVLVYKNNNEVIRESFEISYLVVFEKLIPDKDINYVNTQVKSLAMKETKVEVVSEILKIKELLKEKLISIEEFEKLKMEILGNIKK